MDRIVRLLRPPGSASVDRVVTGNGGLSFNVSTASFIEWSLFMYGEYEPNVTRAIVEHVSTGDNVIDIGANIGVHSLPAARAVGPEGRVFAFEPFDEACSRLEANTHLNSLSNVVTQRVALAAKPGLASFRAPTDENRGTGRLDEHGSMEVTVVSLDSLCLPKARVVKMDVEGAEPQIIAGGREYFDRWRPVVIYEQFPHLQDQTARALAEFGYRVRALDRLTRIAVADN